MIKVSDNLRQMLDSNSRVGIERVIELSSVAVLENSAQTFEVEELSTEPQQFDESSNAKALINRLPGYNEYEYHDFFSWDYFSYDTNNPKKLYVAKEQGQTDDEYYKEFSTGIATVLHPTYETELMSRYIKFTYQVINSANEYSANSLTVEFGKNKNVYPALVRIICYDSNDEIQYVNHLGLSCNILTVNFGELINISKVEIRLYDEKRSPASGSENALNVPASRIKISKIFLGFTKTFSDDIITFSCTRESSLVTDEMPNIEASLVVWDTKRLFDITNPNGLYHSLNDTMIFREYLVYENEKVLIGTYTLKEIPKFEGNETTFTLTSCLLNALERNNKEWVASGLSATDYVNLVINGCFGGSGTPTLPYFKDNDFEMVYPIQTLNIANASSAIEVLQKATNGISCGLIEDVNGKIDIGRFLIRKAGQYVVYKKKSAYSLIQQNICGEVVLENDVLFPETCNINYYSNGEVVGYVDEKYIIHAGVEGGETGDYVLDNDFVVSTAQARFFAMVYNHFKNGKVYTVPYFSDPTIQIGDFVSFPDFYGIIHYGLVLGNNYSYPSATDDSLTVYTIDDIVIDYVEKSSVVKKINSANTDNQIPSAKSVYDAIGDVNSLL